MAGWVAGTDFFERSPLHNFGVRLRKSVRVGSGLGWFFKERFRFAGLVESLQLPYSYPCVQQSAAQVD
jgi:hypothetical protein